MAERPTPESLLEHFKEEEKKATRGKLKIFFGAAPGVGKTYSMLEEALLKRGQGLEVVIGIVESHGRKEINEKCKEFEVLPRLNRQYRSQRLSEFDLDTALERHPALLLVDELAHTNIPGSRHTKRWQDIKELLDRGIDVYTTLNVQHVESLNDIVQQITGVRIRETVPDSILELADTIELVDLPPDELLKRLQEGKIYITAQVKLATEHFFKKSNLVALRELALRYTAEQVNVQTLSQRKQEAVFKTWPTRERLLVCIGPGSGAAKLIRASRRMAARLQAEWIAVFIEAPRLHLNAEEQQSALQNLQLAEQLGAQTIHISGQDLVKEVLAVARSRNVTKIVLSKRIRPRWKSLFFGNLVDELIRNSGEIDIYVIQTGAEKSEKKATVSSQEKAPPSAYLKAFSLTVFASFISYGFSLFNLNESSLFMVYLLAVVVIATTGYRGPAFLASILSILIYNFLFIHPRFYFSVHNLLTGMNLIVMLLISQIITHLTILLKRQANQSSLYERRIAALHTLSSQLATARGVEQVSFVVIRYIKEVFDSDSLILLPDENNKLAAFPKQFNTPLLNEKENSIAQWVFDLGQKAGLGTQTLPESEAVYLPLKTTQGVLGVLRIKPNDLNRMIVLDQLHLIESCTIQIALALEVDRLQENADFLKHEENTDSIHPLVSEGIH